MSSAVTALPPAPTNLLPPPDGAATFDPPPVAVLPGDDLTRFILHSPPPIVSPSPSSRKKKKGRSNKDNATADSSSRADDDDKKVKGPPKIGSGLICTHHPSSTPADSNGEEAPVVRIQAAIAGRLLYRPASRTWYVASNPRRYHLAQSPLASSTGAGVGDRVLGLVGDAKASADYYRVNIGGAHPALLHVLSFEGATKRNRPQLAPGALVYCRILRGFGGRMDPEVSCKVGGDGATTRRDGGGAGDDGGAARKDWMTNEGTYGPLTGGTSCRIPLGLARVLLLPHNAVLSALDKSGIPFEFAVGANGMVWVNSPAPEATIMILSAIKNSEVMSGEQVRGMVKVMVRNLKKELED